MMECHSKDEMKEKARTFENRIIYSLPVRLGLWNEDLALQEEKELINNYKKNNCQLLIQKTKRMFRNLFTPTTLAIEAAYVSYGKYYQIKTSDLSKNLKYTQSTKGLFLSAMITEREIESVQHLVDGCIITASPIRNACIRNTFKIVGACRDKDYGEQVVCGEDIMLQMADMESGMPLYVQCENLTVDTFGQHPHLKLSQVPDFYCMFKILHWDPQKRVETVGTAITPNTRIIIQHSASGQNLAVETNNWIPTFFGAECTVSCQTFRDSHKMETAENFWMITSQPTPNTNLFVRAAKGENIPHDTFES